MCYLHIEVVKDVICHLTKLIYEILHWDKKVFAVFLYLVQAFSTVSHLILQKRLAKLKYYSKDQTQQYGATKETVLDTLFCKTINFEIRKQAYVVLYSFCQYILVIVLVIASVKK